MTISSICCQPGYIFPEGECKGEVPGDAYQVVVKSNHYTGPAVLEKDYVPEGMTLTRGKVIKELVVIGYDPDANMIRVAKDNFFHVLMECYFQCDKGVRVKDERFPHWENDWKAGCSQKVFKTGTFQLVGKTHEKERWFELRGAKCCVPVREIPHLKKENLEGHHQFLPASLYYQNNVPRSLYKLDGPDEDMPLCFQVKVALKKRPERRAHVVLHGFPSPAKWHYGVWQHILKNKAEKERWEAFEGEPVPDLPKSVFRECRKNWNKTSCDEGHCLKNRLFPNVHEEIRELCHRYLKQAVTFFSQETTKTIRMWQGNPFDPQNDPKIAEVKCSNRIELTEFARQLGSKETEREEILILRGHTYDWESAEEPTFHLSVVTLYAGKLEGKTSSHPYAPFEKGRFMGDGKLSILK
ncbi:type III-E CRISPR-associated protein Csx31 [Desulfobacterales bacterium HSG2]|nr:type III-E CRISPR-associated protein Csx31 [Desulfobacterales bacterium HSG2]